MDTPVTTPSYTSPSHRAFTLLPVASTKAGLALRFDRPADFADFLPLAAVAGCTRTFTAGFCDTILMPASSSDEGTSGVAARFDPAFGLDNPPPGFFGPRVVALPLAPLPLPRFFWACRIFIPSAARVVVVVALRVHADW